MIEVGIDTEEWGIGPVALDCVLARAHGWSEADLNAAAQALRRIALRYGGRARRRFPSRYAVDNGVVIFTGKLPDAP